MPARRLVIIFTFFLLKLTAKSDNIFPALDSFYVCSADKIDTAMFNAKTFEMVQHNRPNPILHLFKIKQKKNKKITAAVLAFPFPFGIVGLHRIYLGTAPFVPVVYIGTLGGVLGILPFIDFCVIVLDKNVDRYIENKNVLMWVDDKKPAK
jgi:TM2 domain-containing membrane protein YozV